MKNNLYSDEKDYLNERAPLLLPRCMGLNVHSNLLQLIRDGGKWEMGTGIGPTPTRYAVTTRMTA